MRFEDACTRPHNVHATEFALAGVECVFELFPACDVRLLEYGAWLGGIFAGILVYELFGFGAELEVGEEDVAAAGEEKLCQAVVDTCCYERNSKTLSNEAYLSLLL